MQAAPAYNDVDADVRDFLLKQVAVATRAGTKEKFIDPGIGFGKTVAHNIALLKYLGALNELGYPLVVGTSRKSFIGKLAG